MDDTILRPVNIIAYPPPRHNLEPQLNRESSAQASTLSSGPDPALLTASHGPVLHLSASTTPGLPSPASSRTASRTVSCDHDSDDMRYNRPQEGYPPSTLSGPYDLVEPGVSTSGPTPNYVWPSSHDHNAASMHANGNLWMAPPTTTSVAPVVNSVGNEFAIYPATSTSLRQLGGNEPQIQYAQDYGVQAAQLNSMAAGTLQTFPSAYTTVAAQQMPSWLHMPVRNNDEHQYRYSVSQAQLPPPPPVASSLGTSYTDPGTMAPSYYYSPRAAQTPGPPPQIAWQADRHWSYQPARSDAGPAHLTPPQQHQQRMQHSPGLGMHSIPVQGSLPLHGSTNPRPSPRATSVGRLMRTDPITRAGTAVSTSSSNQSDAQKRRGGRRPGTNLPDETRAHAKNMRKDGACWRCGIQRDSCGLKDPCHRCTQVLQRPHSASQLLIGCDRRKLEFFASWYFVTDEMCAIMKKENVEWFMEKNVKYIYNDRPSFLVPLTFGCGPVIDWVYMVEFDPSEKAISEQLQFKTGMNGINAVNKLSVNVSLVKAEEDKLPSWERYIDRIIDEDLDRFCQKCYEEWHAEGTVQAEILVLLKDLYRGILRLPPPDDKAKSLPVVLRDVLRLIVVTYIMNTVVSIPEQYRAQVLSNMRNPRDRSEYHDHMSPRVAMYQLKLYFTKIRNDVYVRNLKHLHTTLRNAEDKGKSWIRSFVIMLGLAMCLEECQHLHHMQSAAKIRRGQAYPEAAVATEIQRCKTIDEQFDFMINIFHHKYRRKNALYAKMADYESSRASDSPEIIFIHSLQNVLAQSADFLRVRAKMPIAPEHDNYYTSRLVVRFVDIFLGLSLYEQQRPRMRGNYGLDSPIPTR